MDRASVRRRNRLVLEARDEIRQLDHLPTAREIDGKIALKDPALHVKWKAAQDEKHRRRTILQVLREERNPKGSRTTGELPKAAGLQPPVRPAPALVWPLGMRQRKERDRGYKLPWLLPDRGGSERVFLECIGESNLHSVSVTLLGRRVGFIPALRPGMFAEVEWTKNPEVERIVTWGGKREAILAQPRNREAVATLRTPRDDTSPVAEFQRALAQIAEAAVNEIERVMPKDFEAWKRRVWEFPIEVHYTWDTGREEGALRGTLLFDMEHLWNKFRDEEGNTTSIH